MQLVTRWGHALSARLVKSIVESAHYSRFNAPMVGWLGLIGFPLYYYIWHDLFPQPYENFWLRMSGVLVCIPLLFYRRWPVNLKSRFAMYWLLVLVYTLPFFFTYMLLQNNMSMVWSMSIMAALFLLVLAVYDWLMVLLISITGSILAWLVYLATSDGSASLPAYLEQLPIYAFVLIAGSIFNYTAQMVKEEKLDAYAAVGRNIAHELRTPLLGMRSATTALRHHLPELIASYRRAREAGLTGGHIRTSRLDRLEDAARRIEDEITYSNTIIDMLLLSAGQTTLKADDFSNYRAHSAIERALARYPFKSDQETSLVIWEGGPDFRYYGSELLLIHILFNLLKNALHSVIQADKGKIYISTVEARNKNVIIVRDTGPGIPPAQLKHIFEHFYTSKTIDQGSGIGLSFCKLVMESFRGDISCASKPGQYTEFTLMFPRITDEQ